MVGCLLRVWRQESRCLRHLHPSTRGVVVGVDLEEWCRHSELHLRLDRILEAVDVGDGGRDLEGDGLGALRGVVRDVDELDPECRKSCLFLTPKSTCRLRGDNRTRVEPSTLEVVQVSRSEEQSFPHTKEHMSSSWRLPYTR